jgi:hypothetical protein
MKERLICSLELHQCEVCHCQLKSTPITVKNSGFSHCSHLSHRNIIFDPYSSWYRKQIQYGKWLAQGLTKLVNTGFITMVSWSWSLDQKNVSEKPHTERDKNMTLFWMKAIHRGRCEITNKENTGRTHSTSAQIIFQKLNIFLSREESTDKVSARKYLKVQNWMALPGVQAKHCHLGPSWVCLRYSPSADTICGTMSGPTNVGLSKFASPQLVAEGLWMQR